MVNDILTDTQKKAGKELLKNLDKSGALVDAALWYFFDDIKKYKLLIYLADVEVVGPKKSYSVIQKALSKLENKDISLSDIGLLNKSNNILRLLRVAVKTDKKAILSISFTNNIINGVNIKDAFIYRLS